MDELVFDLERLTVRQMSAFFKAAAANDLEQLCALFAQCAASVPKGWGAPGDPATFLDRPYFGEGSFQAVLAAFVAASKNAS